MQRQRQLDENERGEGYWAAVACKKAAQYSRIRKRYHDICPDAKRDPLEASENVLRNQRSRQTFQVKPWWIHAACLIL
jgi:hypothetical protein